ncbi:MAG TPA: right-handed parallel beta-helix repeat-containing protein, partial [Fermentimonas sp.]|nr:right-handed parallel beta-helix repeat-containing protein [Fermentimonas sp.]
MKRINYTIIIGLVFTCFPFFMSYGQGNRYTGSYTKSSAIQHVGKSNFVIEGLEISVNDREAIALYKCENVIIRNNKFGPSNHRAIYLDNCKNITIIDNYFDNVITGLIAHRSQGVKFDHNDVKNVGGLLALTDNPANGILVLFDKVSGEGNSISYNVGENIFGDSAPGDLINVNQSHGTAQSPIIVKGNWLRGGGPAPSGGGILIGDLGGSYQIAEDNILVDPGQYGVGIAGGHNMTLRNNKVYAKSQYFTNVGYSIANWSESQSGKSHTITFEGNTVNYANRDGVKGNSWWIAQNMQPVKGVETNRYDPSLTASILPEQLIGRARAGAPSNPGDEMPGGGSTPLPEEGDNEPEGEQPGPGEDDKGTEVPGVQLPDINNHPSITIYLDRYNR